MALGSLEPPISTVLVVKVCVVCSQCVCLYMSCRVHRNCMSKAANPQSDSGFNFEVFPKQVLIGLFVEE